VGKECELIRRQPSRAAIKGSWWMAFIAEPDLGETVARTKEGI